MSIGTSLWAIGAISVTGLSLGFFFRVQALVAMSVLIAALIGAIGILAGLSGASVASLLVVGLLALQVSYLLGVLLLACHGSARKKRSRPIRATAATVREKS